MTFAALKLRDVAEVQGMLERPVAFVTRGALPCVLVAEIDGMLEHARWWLKRFSSEGLIDRRVTDRTVISDNAAVVTEVLTVMTAETSLSVEVPDVVGMSAPIRFHFREKVGLINLFQLSDRSRDRLALRGENFRIARSIVIGHPFLDRRQGFIIRRVRAGERIHRARFDVGKGDVELSCNK